MLYFDEAGYTGQDLNNKEHPFFTLASVCISKEEESQIKKDIGFDKWRKEIHFSGMFKHPQGRPMLNELYHHPLLDKKRVKLAFADKRYCIYAQIVDTLIETFFHNVGINLYRGADNLLMANCMYYGAFIHPNKDLVDEFERDFVVMLRKPSVESVADFYRTTDKLRFDEDTQESYKELLSLIPQTIVCIKESVNRQPYFLDLTVPLFSESIQHWYRDTNVKHDVLFDNSKPFAFNLDMLSKLRDMKKEETRVGYGISKHVYPFPVGKMETGDSKQHFGIQLADAFASALNFIFTPRKDRYVKYQDYLKECSIFKEVEICIAPSSSDYISNRMKDVDGIDPLDFLSEHI